MANPAAPGPGFNAVLKVDDVVGSTLTALDEITAIEFGGEDVGRVKTTNLTSEGKHHTQVKGWTQCSECTVTANYTAAGFARVAALSEDDFHNYELTLPDDPDGVYTWEAFNTVPSISQIVTEDQAMQMQYKLYLRKKMEIGSGSSGSGG